MKMKIVYCLALTGLMAMASCQKSKCTPHHDCPNHNGTTTSDSTTTPN